MNNKRKQGLNIDFEKVTKCQLKPISVLYLWGGGREGAWGVLNLRPGSYLAFDLVSTKKGLGFIQTSCKVCKVSVIGKIVI